VDKIAQVFEDVLSAWAKGFIYSDVYIEESQSFKLVLEPGRVDELSLGTDSGIGMRRISSDFSTEYHFVAEPNPKKLIDLLGLKKFKTLPSQISLNLKKFGLEDLKRRYEFLKSLTRTLKKEAGIVHYRVLLSEVVKKVGIFSLEEGLKLEERKYFKVVAVVVAEDRGKIESGYEVVGRALDFESAVEDEAFWEVVKKAGKLAKLMLSAKRAPAGVMPVVLSGEAGGTMIHEAVGHGLEADHAEAGLSVYSGRIGERVASPIITVVDDPTIKGLYGSYGIDDEGKQGERVILIENGILKNYLYDKLTALKYGKESNGHGRRESFKYPPIPRMSNTFIAPGKSEPEEVIKSIDKGLLVKKMGGGEVNPLTGDFVFEVREGYYIEGGEVTYPVKGATLVGNGPKVLEKIDMVAGDIHFEPGTCGKDGQGVPVSDGEPTLRIPEITVGGELD